MEAPVAGMRPRAAKIHSGTHQRLKLLGTTVIACVSVTHTLHPGVGRNRYGSEVVNTKKERCRTTTAGTCLPPCTTACNLVAAHVGGGENDPRADKRAIAEWPIFGTGLIGGPKGCHVAEPANGRGRVEGHVGICFNARILMPSWTCAALYLPALRRILAIGDGGSRVGGSRSGRQAQQQGDPQGRLHRHAYMAGNEVGSG